MITADDNEKFYGASVPLLTYRISGFVNGESIAQLSTKPVISTKGLVASPVGQYPITISGAVAANYSITFIAGILTIKEAPPTITIPNAFTPNGEGINELSP